MQHFDGQANIYNDAVVVEVLTKYFLNVVAVFFFCNRAILFFDNKLFSTKKNDSHVFVMNAYIAMCCNAFQRSCSRRLYR